MANKQTRVTFGGLNRDISKSKFQATNYFDAVNIKLTPVEGQTFGALSNAYGNLKALELPTPVIDPTQKTITYGSKTLTYINTEIDNMTLVGGPQIIIGHVQTTRGVILFSTDNNGVDCIWEVPDLDEDTLEVNLVYLRDMDFTTSRLIQAIFNYENELIQKIYWVDGENFLRFLNVRQSIENGFEQELIDVPVTSVNSKSTVDISKPTVESGGGGGSHTAGVIQYGYTLYNLNGAETSLSPLSDLFPLDKGVGEGGGDVNEVVGAMPVVVIEDVDVKYSFIKLYAVKYTSYNGTPEIKTIYDGAVGNYDRFTFNDTGTHNLGSLSISEFVFLGADPIKPAHIATKDNILFAANNKSTAYKFDIDARAYSFNESGTSAEIFDSVVYNGVGDIPFTGTKLDVASVGYDGVPEDFDCVNLDFDKYRYTLSGGSNNPGGPILTAATYGATVQGSAPSEVYALIDYTNTIAVSNTCNTANSSPTYYEVEFSPPGGTNNRIQVTTTGLYSVETFAGFDLEAPGLAKSSENVYIQVYASATSGTLLDETRATELPIPLFDDKYTGSVPAQAGQWIRIVAKVGVHYSNDTCPYECNDSLSTGDYAGDGPFVGPNEAGQTASGTLEVEWSFCSLFQTEIADKQVPLPLVATNGESTITNGKYVADYIGSFDSTVKVFVSQNNLQQSKTDLYSLGIFKNGSIISSQNLNLVNAGIITRTFYFNNISVVDGDEIELRLINNKADYPGQDGSLISDEINMAVTGDFTMVEGISGGSNGEGGTGKYLEYELTRTSFDNLGLDLRQARFFKDNEIYRIGVIFFNRIGQASEVKWIADFKAPVGNLEGQYNTLRVEFNYDFYDYINTLSEADRPTNYNIVRAVRNSTDKTIISQGLLTGMFVQDVGAEVSTIDTYEKRGAKNPGLVKYPVPMTRGFGNGKTVDDSYFPVFPTKHNILMNNRYLEDSEYSNLHDQDPRANKTPRDIIVDEIYRDRDDSFRRQQSWQYTKLFQMHSPEATFSFPLITTDKDQLHVLGYMKRDEWRVFDYNIDVNTFGPHLSDKTKQFTANQSAHFYPYAVGGYGVIGPSYRRWEDNEARPEYVAAGYATREPAKHARRMHLYKSFTPLVRPNQPVVHEIYNRPEITEIGQSIVAYNNDPALQYSNKLTFVKSDVKQAGNAGTFGGSDAPGITTVISEGSRCLTMALGDNNLVAEDRPGLDDLYDSLGTGEWDVELFGEIRKEASYVYSGAIYGGYSVSSRSRTEYISIGDVADIDQRIVQINSPGDTFVQIFRNTRLTRTPGSVYDISTQCMVETLEYLVETTVNLAERNDSSLKSWDYLVDPTAEQGTNYNRVYSTDNALITYSPDSLKIREVVQKETEIMPSKVKSPAEFVESWVDFRPDNAMSLDGKHGPINAFLSHFDQLYAFQDYATAVVSVNPRVQTVGNDGVGVELGTGTVLHDYQYLSTKTGSINKWGIVSANSGLYFMDANLKQIQRITQGVEGVSEAKGLHSFLQTSLDRDSLRIDNPVLGDGVTAGYDVANGDVYFSVRRPDNDYTVAFNEKMNAFTSFYSFTPNSYFSRGEKLFSVEPAGNEAFVHGVDNYQTFYGEKHEAYVTLLVNTDEPGAEKVFNNLEFDSEVTLDDVDVSGSTIDSLEAWTDYQTSGKIPLTINGNLKRRFRTWRASIPREEGKRNRLRDKWIYLKLGFNPEENYKLVLHDIVVSYGT